MELSEVVVDYRNEAAVNGRKSWAESGCYRRGTRGGNLTPGGLLDKIETPMSNSLGDRHRGFSK